MPAPFDRVKLQLEAVSPWVDKILVYQYLGMMNRPGTTAFGVAGIGEALYGLSELVEEPVAKRGDQKQKVVISHVEWWRMRLRVTLSNGK